MIVLVLILTPVQGVLAQPGEVLFFEDFEGGSRQWEIPGSRVLTQEYAFEGSHSQTFARVTHGGDAHTYPFPVVPGQTYYLPVAYMTLGGGGYTGVDLFDRSLQKMGEQWLMGDGSYAATLKKFDYNVFNKNREDPGVWKMYTQSYTIPDQVYFIRIKTQNWDMGLSNSELSVKVRTGSRRELKIASRANLKPASIVPKDSEMVLIPEGEFLMGSSEKDIDEAMKLCEESRGVAPNIQCDRADYKDEMPQHKVRLDAFYIDKYPVTNRQFMKFVEATGYKTDAEKDRIGLIVRWAGNYEGEIITREDGSVNWRSPFGRRNEINNLLDHPVVQVSWNDAVAYCQWAGKRLPTEAEWEKAARGTDGRLFPWGHELPDAGGKYRANYGKDRGKADGFEYTSPVGSFPLGASPYGVMDMAGNVWEWVADWYDETYYATSPAENPQGPASGKGRVLRGGSWGNRPESIRTAVRLRSEPNSGISYIGFRCARSY